MGRKAKNVIFSADDRARLTNLVKKRVHSARKITRARALLRMEKEETREQIQTFLGIDANHYYRIKKRYLSNGLLSYALEELRRSGPPRKVIETVEAQITKIACSDVPAGSVRWTLQWIAAK